MECIWSCGVEIFHQRGGLVEVSPYTIPVYNVDSTPNEAGSITEVVNLILCHKNHLEQTMFAITSLGKQKLLLGHSWLQNHNPKINWAKGEVKMYRCPPLLLLQML